MTNVTLITYTVPDMTKARQFFGELIGEGPYADTPYYVGYKDGDLEIGLVPAQDGVASWGLAYWTVSDIAATVKRLVAAGGTVDSDIKDVSHGLLVATVKDPNGAIIGLRQFPKG